MVSKQSDSEKHAAEYHELKKERNALDEERK